MVKEFIELKAKKTKTWGRRNGYSTRYVLPEWRYKSVKDIDKVAVSRLLDKIEKKRSSRAIGVFPFAPRASTRAARRAVDRGLRAGALRMASMPEHLTTDRLAAPVPVVGLPSSAFSMVSKTLPLPVPASSRSR